MIRKSLNIALATTTFLTAPMLLGQETVDSMDIGKHLADGVELYDVELENVEENYELEQDKANRYATVCIGNHLRYAKKYSIKWGNGPWKSRSVAPGKLVLHSWRYSRVNENRSPVILIRFDSDMSSKKFFSQYRLEPYASPDQRCSSARKYRFKYENDRRYVDLKG